MAGLSSPSIQSKITDIVIQEKIDARNDARKNRDFVEADRIRDSLAADGIHLEDSADGTIWRRG